MHEHKRSQHLPGMPRVHASVRRVSGKDIRPVSSGPRRAGGSDPGSVALSHNRCMLGTMATRAVEDQVPLRECRVDLVSMAEALEIECSAGGRQMEATGMTSTVASKIGDRIRALSEMKHNG